MFANGKVFVLNRTFACHMVMDVAVMTANKCPVRATRSARIGSFSGIAVCTGPLLLEASEGESSKSCSTDLMPGVWGKGVMGVGGWIS